MQTNSIQGKSIGVLDACKEMIADSKQFGLRGAFRGQGVYIYYVEYNMPLNLTI